MLYNLRSDIIYYKSSSDFELEFNLCGCCRMRLLTDKPSNKKAFVHSLARAVSRSRVIIIAGAIFGEENTIQIVSQALGTTTEMVDNSAYNIASDDEIEIIKGSIPLVSSDGSFGGCIIESGPQTMILLTDNKTLRKNIMSNLIHPYISELYAAEVKANSETPAPTKETVETENTVATEEVAVTEEAVITEETEALPLEEIAPSADEIPAEEEELITETETEEIPTQEVIADEVITYTQQVEDEIAELNNTIDINTLYTDTKADNDNEAEIPEDISEPQVVLEVTNEEPNDFREEYNNVFNDLYLEDAKEQKQNSNINNQQPAGYQVLYDNGDVIDNTAVSNEPRTSRLNIATIVITAILLLSIIVLCCCIFSAAANEGSSPAEYVRSVWQTVFG